MKLLIDYELLATNAERAMRKVTALFVRAGLEIISVGSNGKAARIAGISYREATYTFADNQTLSLRIKVTGDVYEVRINGKVVPIKEQDDPTKAAAELVAMLDKTRARHQKRLAALKMVPPEGAKTAAPKLREKLVQQIAEVDAAIDAAKEELAELSV
jgi:deoxycytidylate deaminase